MTRTSASLKNLYTALIGQAAGIMISFVSRRAFLRCLSEEYLGISGLFTNILTVLSLAELGVGTAMTFALYKPLAENDIPVIKSLMRLYRRAYTAIGAVVLLLAAAFTPFYTVFMGEVPDIPHLTVIYLLYAANTGVSYFFIYKRTLIICDQKRYVATIYRYSFFFFLNLAQIAVLFVTGSYVLFMAVQVIFTIAENIAVSRAADKMYPYLREKDVLPLPEDITEGIKRNIKAMLIHKCGGAVVNSTDNILLSKLVSLAAAGIYSNYYMISGALDTVIMQVFGSVSASVGNLNAEDEDKSRLMESFYRIFFLNFWIYGFCTVCLVCLYDPFIGLWLGRPELTFGTFTVIMICARFFFAGMRRTVLTYREAAGAFWYDRYKPLFEIAVNLTASIMLARSMGAAGIFLGTVISTLTVCIWVEPYVLYKHVFKAPAGRYFALLGLYTAVTAAAAAITMLVCGRITISSPVAALAAKAGVCAALPNIIFLIVFGRTEEFGYFASLVRGIMIKFFGKLKNKQKKC